jgi:hypothetical protein
MSFVILVVVGWPQYKVGNPYSTTFLITVCVCVCVCVCGIMVLLFTWNKITKLLAFLIIYSTLSLETIVQISSHSFLLNQLTFIVFRISTLNVFISPKKRAHRESNHLRTIYLTGTQLTTKSYRMCNSCRNTQVFA